MLGNSDLVILATRNLCCSGCVVVRVNSYSSVETVKRVGHMTSFVKLGESNYQVYEIVNFVDIQIVMPVKVCATNRENRGIALRTTMGQSHIGHVKETMGGRPFVEENFTFDFVKFIMNQWGGHLWMGSNSTDRCTTLSHWIPMSDGMCNCEVR